MTPRSATRPISSNHIGLLDLVRGFLAFWVYYGHLKMACIGKDVLWGSPAIAVDGFMLLSGFLMVYHWLLRQETFPSLKEQIKDFYLRRFFRIAPLYYLLLTFVLSFQDKLLANKAYVNKIIPPAWGGAVIVMDSPKLAPVDFWNVITHFSFTFGLLPKFANVNMLPDWSISLEMQFYFIFPILVFLIARFGGTFMTFMIFIVTLVANKFIGLHEHAGIIARYPQPSLLLFKLNIFLAGMAIAYAYLSQENKKKVFWMILGAFALFNGKEQVWIVFAIISLILFFDLEGNDLFSKVGNSKFSKFLGDTSYGLYLLHLIVMYPVLYLAFQTSWYRSMAIYPRLLLTLGIVSPIVYLLAYLLYRLVERNGILFGKKLSTSFIQHKGQ